jgi:hypothetical protein
MMGTYERPEYDQAREDAGFAWRVSAGQGAYRALSGVPIHAFNLDPEQCIRAHRVGRERVAEVFGDVVQLAGPATPAISYGHANGLGAELIFPEGGEVAHTHPFEALSLEEATQRLRQPIDWETQGVAPEQLACRDTMAVAFPGEAIGFGYGMEGPITTAYELLGERLFTELHDGRDQMPAFLDAVADSIVDFHLWREAMAGRLRADTVAATGAADETTWGQVSGDASIDRSARAHPSPHAGGMVDDIASMVHPSMWPEMVMPSWDRYFDGITTGRRSAHVEDLRMEQLPYLEQIGLSSYDPSISHKLTPPLIEATIRVPFAWRLGCFHYMDLDEAAVRDWVLAAAADGASSVFTIIAESMCDGDSHVSRVHAFAEAGNEVAERLAAGDERQALRDRMTAAGRLRFWNDWPRGSGVN